MGTPSVSVNKILEEYKTLTPAQQRQVNKEITQIIREQSNRSKIPGQKVEWNGISIDFKPNTYISNYKDIWQMESIIGAEVIERSLQKQKKPTLDTRFVERLFRQSSYSFYIDSSEKYLISVHNELMESDFGPLTQLTSLDALRRYGLRLLEESKEKGYVRL